MLLNLRAQYATTTARQTADAVITALTPAAWYRNATDVVSSGGFASIWADYASNAKGLVLPGVAGNYASVPDAGYWPTGSIDIIIRMSMLDWTPPSYRAICGKGVSGASCSFVLFMDTSSSGKLTFRTSVDGTTSRDATSSAGTGITDAAIAWIRVTRDSASGDVNFYKAADSATVPSSWTQIGTTQSTTAGAIFNSVPVLEIGACNGNATQSDPSQVIYRTIIKDGINGTTVFDADFSSQAIGAASFTESSSNAATVTINTSGAAPAHIGKARDLLQGTGTNQPAYANGVFTFDGADNWMQVAFALNQPSSIIFVGSQVSWTSSDALLDGASVNRMKFLQRTATPNLGFYAGAFGLDNAGMTVGARKIVASTANGASSSFRINNAAKVTADAGAANSDGLTLGAGGGAAGSAYGNCTFEEVILFPSALSDANQNAVITALNNALTVF